MRTSHVIIMGDLNMSATNWEILQSNKDSESNILDIIQDMYWTQHETNPLDSEVMLTQAY